MTFSDELRHTLQTMGFVQLLLVLVFLGGYVTALSGLTGALGRQRAAALALAAAIGFAAVTPAWAIGAMLMVLAIGGVGLFVAAVVALDRFSANRAHGDYAAFTASASGVALIEPAELAAVARSPRRRKPAKRLSAT